MDLSSSDRSFEAAGDHQKDEGPPVAELDLNIVTSKNESEPPKTEAWSNYMKEDGNQLDHHGSPILPSDVSYDGIVSNFVISDSKISEEPCLPSQSELAHDDGKGEALNSEGLSSPAKVDIYHDEDECGAPLNKLPSPLENEKNHVGVENENSTLCLQEPPFGVDNNHHCEVLDEEDYIQKSHELPFIDEPANVHSGDLSGRGSTQFEGPEFYQENVDERNGDHHLEMKGGFNTSDKQHMDHEENPPGDSDVYFPQGFQERSTSPVSRERSITPERPSQIQPSKQEGMPSDVNHTGGSPFSTRSPRNEFSPSPRRPDKGHRRAPSHDRFSPPKRRKSSSPVRTAIGDSDQRVDSPCERSRSSSPGRTPQKDLDNRDDSPRKHLSVSPLRQDSPQKHDSPKNRDSLRRQGSPRRKYSPRRRDSPRRQDSPRRGDSPRRDSPRRGDSPRRRDSPRRGDSPRKSGSSRKRDSPRRRDSSGGDSPRKHISASPRRRDSSRRRDRSMSRSPPGRRDSSGHRRDRHDRSRSRSPYGRDHHRRSPRRRHSPRRRSPSPGYHSRRHSPRRRPWSPPSNRSTGIGRPGKNLFVAGFSFVTTERDLEKKFSRFGRVTDVRIVRDKRSGDSRGFGFLSLERDEDADAAIRALDQTEWNGRIVLVEKAKTSVR